MESRDAPAASATPLRLWPVRTVGTPLFGREQDLAAIRRLLADGARLLTLTGPAGTGKSRLACAAAQQAMAEFGPAVGFVDLSAVDDAALVPATVGRAIGVQESGSEPPERIVREVIGPRPVLLVLDNFEQVLEAGIFVSDLLAACPSVCLLVTSREPLHLRAERVWAVAPLPVPGAELDSLRSMAGNPAVALFVDRARACRPSFALSQRNVQAVAEICTRLDGLPLAIELAAAQVRVMSPEAILERLRAHAPFVLRAAVDLPARHRTLRAAVASSYELLGEPEQAVFRWCGVFSGAFDAAAVRAVYADEAERDLLPSLALLADKNLLQVVDDNTTETRFRWLETIRGFAVDLLSDKGELASARRRHADYFLKLAEQAEAALVGHDMAHTLDALERAYDNFRAVFHWALEGGDLEIGLRLAGALYRFWSLRGHLREARQWLERALDQATDQPAAVRAKALNAAGVLAGMQDDNASAQAYFEKSLAAWREVGDTRRVAAAIGNLGLVAQNRQELERALACFCEAQLLYEQAADRRGVAVSLGCRGRVERQRGHHAVAMTLFEQSVPIFREAGDDRSLANSLANLGLTALGLHDLARSRSYFRQALALRQALGNTLGIAECLEGFAAVAAAAGQRQRAARLYGAAEALRETTGAPVPTADRSEYDHLVARLRAELGEEQFASAWAAGRTMRPDDAVRLVLRERAAPPPPPGVLGTRAGRPVLTRREREVTALVALGLTNREVADRLVVAQRTVETHLEHIFAKLGVQTRAELVAWTLRQNLAEPRAQPAEPPINLARSTGSR